MTASQCVAPNPSCPADAAAAGSGTLSEYLGQVSMRAYMTPAWAVLSLSTVWRHGVMNSRVSACASPQHGGGAAIS